MLVLFLITNIKLNAHDFEVNNIYYEITSETDKTVSVTNRDADTNCYSGDIVIPEKVVYDEIEYTVNSIGNNSFEECKNLVSVEIPNSVVSIGNSAFRSCSSLISIEIPNSVISIGNKAFSFCDHLANIIIPNSVTSIGYAAFEYCRSLKSITLSLIQLQQ